jgi:S-adenosylmethionine:tRNA ribosyltransferase-isomerase
VRVKEVFSIDDFKYGLPEDRIAKYPLAKRDESKLLLWRKGQISHHQFSAAPELVPESSLLVFNDTRVISARLLFQKSTGARIEIFLLHPELPTRDIQASMAIKGMVTWYCLVGNKKKWKGEKLKKQVGNAVLTASYHSREKNLIRFEWTGKETFAEIVNKSGETPLPPYMNRKPEKEDSARYQTVYSKNDGAVAAPTAGLHFTESMLNKFQKKEIDLEYLTLHVSAGTFKPVEAADYRNHNMHCEQIVITVSSIENLLKNHDKIVAVGTTSLRILESLYWYGVLLSNNPDAPFTITKNLPYLLKSTISFHESLLEILQLCKKLELHELHGETEIFIYPGYQIKSAAGLFTNFHLPKSTLLLLISSFVDGAWKEIYETALTHDYRFLSYGDSSLLLR